MTGFKYNCSFFGALNLILHIIFILLSVIMIISLKSNQLIFIYNEVKCESGDSNDDGLRSSHTEVKECAFQIYQRASTGPWLRADT